MSFLLFASRKIQIRRELNTKNYELDLITQKYNEATKKVAAGDFTVELETKRDDEIRGINA